MAKRSAEPNQTGLDMLNRGGGGIPDDPQGYVGKISASLLHA